jgi:hypothetical protein
MEMGCPARLAPHDAAMSRLTTIGAVFLALAAVKEDRTTHDLHMAAGGPGRVKSP